MESGKKVAVRLLSHIGKLKRGVVEEEEKGGLTMSKRILTGLVGMVVGMVVFAGLAHAGSTSTCVIYVTPPTNYSVQISTPDGGIDFGDVKLDTIYISSSVAGGIGISTVTNNGNVTSDWKIRAESLDDWTLTSRSGNTKDTVAEDQMNLTVILSSTTYEGDVGEGDFDNYDIAENTSYDMFAGSYTITGSPAADGDGNGIQKDEQRRIWFRIKTPDNTTVKAEQKFRVYVEAWDAGTF